MDEVKDDPVKKAGLIRDIVATISKIPNQIQREIYVQECAKIMDISERVLFSELAQLSKKEERDASKRSKEDQQEAFVIERKDENITIKKIDELNILERKIIETLLLHGNKEIDFVDFVEVQDEDGRTQLLNENYQNTIVNEIYLNLQDDEIEFSNAIFKKIYFDIIHLLNQDEKINAEVFINHEDVELSKVVTDILMDEEKHILSNWERKEIYVRSKEQSLAKLVMDAILNLRRIWIDLKIKELMDGEVLEEERSNLLEIINNYNKLRNKLSYKLTRVV